MNLRLLPVALSLLLTACEIPGMGPDPKVVQREAEGKAIGGACRQALRSIEDCYTMNDKAIKTSVYEGWREMDEYMRENKLEGQRPLYGKDRELAAQPVVSEKADKEETIIDEKKSAGNASGTNRPGTAGKNDRADGKAGAAKSS